MPPAPSLHSALLTVDIPRASLVLYCCVGHLCATIFSFFKCDYTFPDIDRSYLEMDYTIDCDSERYKEARWFVIIMIFLYPVGIPILYFALLYRERHILIDPPPTAKRCFFRNTDGDYMVFASEQRKPPWAS